MIIDLRIYTIIPGKVTEYIGIYEREALETQKKILGRMVGYFVSEIGSLNQLVQLWAYSDLADREERRARLWADPAFIAAAKNLYPLILKQENTILRPTDFSPMR